jgi:hypothetical protein
MPPINANQLRALAERADSHRDGPVWLVRDRDSGEYDIATELTERLDPLIQLQTTNSQPFLERASTLQLRSDPELELVDFPGQGIGVCDAIFCGIVPFEKFVIPYYTRFSTPAEMAKMREEYCTTPQALAVAHVPDSVESLMRPKSELLRSGENSGSLFVLRSTSERKLEAIPFRSLLR